MQFMATFWWDSFAIYSRGGSYYCQPATDVPVTRRRGRGMGEIITSQVGCYALELTLAYLQFFALKSTLNQKKNRFNIWVKWFEILLSTYAHGAENRTHNSLA